MSAHWFSDPDPDAIASTKRGKAVATLPPIERASASLIGVPKGKLHVRGDILSTGAPWDAQRGCDGQDS